MKTKDKYDLHAKVYDFITGFAEKRYYSKWRAKYFTPLKGKILEVGVGTGNSIKYFNDNASVIGIDFSEQMLNKARDKLKQSGRKNITLDRMNVEQLDFEDNTFDYVVTSCVFCSVPDPVKGLREIKRVLKTTGQLIMIEHVLSNNPLIALIERLHNPLMKFFTGVNINRNTGENIEKAGLNIEEERNLALHDVFRLYKTKKEK